MSELSKPQKPKKKRKYKYHEIRIRLPKDMKDQFYRRTGPYKASDVAVKLIRAYNQGLIKV